jgi:hypothetical protein
MVDPNSRLARAGKRDRQRCPRQARRAGPHLGGVRRQPGVAQGRILRPSAPRTPRRRTSMAQHGAPRRRRRRTSRSRAPPVGEEGTRSYEPWPWDELKARTGRCLWRVRETEINVRAALIERSSLRLGRSRLDIFYCMLWSAWHAHRPYVLPC